MNGKKINEYCSKVEEKYGLKPRRARRCPRCGETGKPMAGNDLVWLHRVETSNGHLKYHRWSYITGRAVDSSAEETNIL